MHTFDRIFLLHKRKFVSNEIKVKLFDKIRVKLYTRESGKSFPAYIHSNLGRNDMPYEIPSVINGEPVIKVVDISDLSQNPEHRVFLIYTRQGTFIKLPYGRNIWERETQSYTPDAKERKSLEELEDYLAWPSEAKMRKSGFLARTIQEFAPN